MGEDVRVVATTSGRRQEAAQPLDSGRLLIFGVAVPDLEAERRAEEVARDVQRPVEGGGFGGVLMPNG